MQESLGRLSRVVFCQCDVMNRIDAASSGGIMGLFCYRRIYGLRDWYMKICYKQNILEKFYVWRIYKDALEFIQCFLCI